MHVIHFASFDWHVPDPYRSVPWPVTLLFSKLLADFGSKSWWNGGVNWIRTGTELARYAIIVLAWNFMIFQAIHRRMEVCIYDGLFLNRVGSCTFASINGNLLLGSTSIHYNLRGSRVTLRLFWNLGKIIASNLRISGRVILML